MTKKRKTQTEIIEALQKSAGVISDAAKLLGLNRSALSRRINDTPALLEIKNEILEDAKDLAESVIYQALKAGDKDIAKWFLARQARDRGYGERLDVEGKMKVETEQRDLSKLSTEELHELERIVKKSAETGRN